MLGHLLLLLCSCFGALTTAHFTLEWPTARGFDDDKEPSFPCGGFDSVSSNRTSFPLSGPAPIQLTMGHTEANVQVLLAVGNDPGSAFNIELRQTFRERGTDLFCIGGIEIPPNANLTAGSNATIQVVTNGDPTGGLYQCADITLTDDPLSDDDYNSCCTNSSGAISRPIGNPRNANETNEDSPTSTGAAAAVGSWAGAWAFGAAAVGAAVALL